MNTILITGATGNLGSRALVEFLQKTDAKIVVLVYGKNREDVLKQVDATFHFWDIPQASRERVEVIHGDITHETLGFSLEDYTRLTSEVTHIIHCAANFKLDLSLDDARASIVEATKHMVIFAQLGMKQGVFKHFNYISSLDAAGNMQGSIPETFLRGIPREFLNTYQQAKAEAEDFLQDQFEQHNFPVTVYRPSMLVGDSETGKIINPQSLYHIINDMFLNPSSRVLPGKTFKIDPVPIDFVARGLLVMYDDAETLGRVYHFVSGYESSLSLPDFIDSLQKIYMDATGEMIPKPRFIPPHVPFMILSIARLFTRGSLRKKLSIQRDMVRYFFLDMRPENIQTKTFLNARNITIPNIRSYLPVLCRYVLETKIQPASLHESVPVSKVVQK